jgi:hypothetical protein
LVKEREMAKKMTAKSVKKMLKRIKPWGPRPGSMRIDAKAKHLLDLQISEGPDDEELTPKEVARWIGYSDEWLKKARVRGDAPECIRYNQRVITYRRGAVRKWLRERNREDRVTQQEREERQTETL